MLLLTRKWLQKLSASLSKRYININLYLKTYENMINSNSFSKPKSQISKDLGGKYIFHFPRTFSMVGNSKRVYRFSTTKCSPVASCSSYGKVLVLLFNLVVLWFCCLLWLIFGFCNSLFLFITCWSGECLHCPEKCIYTLD